MARLAVFASGTGSNFVAIAAALKAAHRHGIEFLLCDVEGATVLDRAAELGFPTMLMQLRRASRARRWRRRSSGTWRGAGWTSLPLPAS